MNLRRSGRDIHGIVLLDKPAGWSSNQAVQRVRRLLRARKAGHTGSLDPFATGMLPICLGEATKTAAFMLQAGKRYHAVACLGQATDTGDIEGEVLSQQPVPAWQVQHVEAVLSGFTGPIAQVPPMYSALKYQGQPLYKLARQGISVERNARQVVIHRLELKHWQPPLLTFEVQCSKGTYIRTLAEEISGRLGSCGHLRSLRRLEVEPFAEDRMVSIETIEQAVSLGRETRILLPPDAGLAAWPELHLDTAAAERFRHGNPVAGDGIAGMVRVFSASGEILGLGEARPDGMVCPKRVFVYAAERA
jgi:tRNA pseudouridine55 synthase